MNESFLLVGYEYPLHDQRLKVVTRTFEIILYITLRNEIWWRFLMISGLSPSGAKTILVSLKLGGK